MKIKEIVTRCAVTAVAAITASPVGSIVFNVGYLKTLGITALVPVVNLVGRLAQRWLTTHPE